MSDEVYETTVNMHFDVTNDFRDGTCTLFTYQNEEDKPRRQHYSSKHRRDGRGGALRVWPKRMLNQRERTIVVLGR